MCPVLLTIVVSFIQPLSKYRSSVNSVLELGRILPANNRMIQTPCYGLHILEGKRTKPTKKMGDTNYNKHSGGTIAYLPLRSYEITHIIPVV